MSNISNALVSVQRLIVELTFDMENSEYVYLLRELSDWARTQADKTENGESLLDME